MIEQTEEFWGGFFGVEKVMSQVGGCRARGLDDAQLRRGEELAHVLL